MSRHPMFSLRSRASIASIAIAGCATVAKSLAPAKLNAPEDATTRDPLTMELMR